MEQLDIIQCKIFERIKFSRGEILKISKYQLFSSPQNTTSISIGTTDCTKKVKLFKRRIYDYYLDLNELYFGKFLEDHLKLIQNAGLGVHLQTEVLHCLEYATLDPQTAQI